MIQSYMNCSLKVWELQNLNACRNVPLFTKELEQISNHLKTLLCMLKDQLLADVPEIKGSKMEEKVLIDKLHQ